MSPGLTYRGRLAVNGDPLDLVVDLRIEGGAVELRTPRESLGVWPVANVSVDRLEDGRFVLSLGNEEAFFRAEDPLSFSYEAISALEVEQTRLRSRLRAYLPMARGGQRPPAPVVEEELSPLKGVFAAHRAVSETASPLPRGRHLRSAEQGA